MEKMATAVHSVRSLQEPESGLGVAAGGVEISSHNPIWSRLYEAFATDVVSALGPQASVEHIGSTSVPGLAAKPILDVAVGMREPIDEKKVVASLTALGLAYQGDLGIYGGRLFTAEADPGVVVLNLHVVDVDDFQWRWYLKFCDGLRSDRSLVAEYEALKRSIADSHGDDREGYNKAKFDWVLNTVSRLDRSASEDT